eukprot:Opistho-1_new@23925
MPCRKAQLCYSVPLFGGAAMMSRTLIALAIGICAGSPAQSQNPPARWQVNVAPAQCTLSGTLRHPEVTAISISTTPGSGSYTLMLAGRELHRRPAASQGSVRIGFDTVGAPTDRQATFLHLQDDGRAIRIEGLPAALADAFARTSRLTVEVERSRTSIGAIMIPGSASAMQALKTCIAEQLVAWGADRAQFLPGGTPAITKTDPDGWLVPAQMRKLPFDGEDHVDMVLKLDLAPDGMVDGCAQVAGLENKPANDAACRMLRNRWLFVPARNPAGVAVRGVGTYRVRMIRVLSVVSLPPVDYRPRAGGLRSSG